MRKYKYTRVLEMTNSLKAVHTQVQQNINANHSEIAKDLLAKCQEIAINVGNIIEESEGEGFITVSFLEKYCEIIFEEFEDLTDEAKSRLDNFIDEVINSLKSDITVKKEAVFLPYKASMWDSLESVYLAAKEDQNCEAFVIPIPYYDKDDNGNAVMMHYEADLMPEDIPITKYDEYDFAAHRPDMIFIHNPYDDFNYVTSVLPFFYSKNLKQYTDMLVYIPYYATSGGSGDAYALLPAYINADYIIIQSEDQIAFIDEVIPREKILSLGSPKFDAVIGKCKNPPEVPSDWKSKIYDEKGNKKKVYFYNTSLGGMLADTSSFLKKMKYVFDTFKKHPEVCLLWRPHPLMESSFDRLRPEDKVEFERLKKSFIEDDLGIYDTTPHIENTIANCDVYVGDAATSVTSLFGVTGKPLFILNNLINEAPRENDWRGSNVFQGFLQTEDGKYHDRFVLGPENTLYYSPNDDYHYEFYCSLVEETQNLYMRAYEYKDKVYVFPSSAQHILVVDKKRKIKKIELPKLTAYAGAFNVVYVQGETAYLAPLRYPALVKFNMETEEFLLVDGVRDYNVFEEGNIRIPGARWIRKDKLYITSKDGSSVLIFKSNNEQPEVKALGLGQAYYAGIIKNHDCPEVWLLPAYGTVVVRWNIETDEVVKYDLKVEGLESFDRDLHYITDRYIFGSMAFLDGEVVFAPNWGNKFVKLNPKTGKVCEWDSPFDTSFENHTGYIVNYGVGGFFLDTKDVTHNIFYYAPKREFYDIDLQTRAIMKLDYDYNLDDIFSHSSGYGPCSEWLRYGCIESVFNTLEDLLTDSISGDKFSEEAQIEAFTNINASPAGDCGKKVYEFAS